MKSGALENLDLGTAEKSCDHPRNRVKREFKTPEKTLTDARNEYQLQPFIEYHHQSFLFRSTQRIILNTTIIFINQ